MQKFTLVCLLRQSFLFTLSDIWAIINSWGSHFGRKKWKRIKIVSTMIDNQQTFKPWTKCWLIFLFKLWEPLYQKISLWGGTVACFTTFLKRRVKSPFVRILFQTDPSAQTLALESTNSFSNYPLITRKRPGINCKTRQGLFCQTRFAQPTVVGKVPATGLIDYQINDVLSKFPIRFAFIILVPWNDGLNHLCTFPARFAYLLSK